MKYSLSPFTQASPRDILCWTHVR